MGTPTGFTPDRWQSKTLLTIVKCWSKIAINSVFDCYLSPVWRQLAIKNSVSNYFWSTFVDSVSFSIAAYEVWSSADTFRKRECTNIKHLHSFPILLSNFSGFFLVCWFFLKINYFEKFFQEYHLCVKQFRSSWFFKFHQQSFSYV